MGSGGIKQKGKDLMDKDNSVVIWGSGLWVEVEEGIRRINGMRKYNKNILFTK